MNLACKQCGYENESERVYCHNCGSKLDRSVLPEATRQTSESSGAVRRRIRDLSNPGRFTLSRLLKMIFSAVLYGFIAAALIAAALPPSEVPPRVETLEAPEVTSLIEKSLGSRQPITFSQDQLNEYLSRTIRARKSENWMKYERTFVRLRPGTAWTSLEFSLFDYPLYATVGYDPVREGGKIVAKNVGGYLGRLPVHPVLMPYLTSPFQTLWDALKHEREMLARMQAVRVADQAVTLVPPAASVPAGE